MSSVECLLLKLVGALSFEGRDEFSSSILLYHFSSQFLQVIGWGILNALGNQSPSFSNFLPPNKMCRDEIQCLC